ncbi:MAG: hypothetical protein JTT14_00010 [Candidatus Brockarchaeota archaeon]|nr:hypothetical protein [Candidatus Brockarchaeota archaeon]
MTTILLDKEELEKNKLIQANSRYLVILSKLKFYKTLVTFHFVSSELKRGKKGIVVTPNRTIPIEILIEKFLNTKEQLSKLLVVSLTDLNQELAFFKKLPIFLLRNKIDFLFFDEPSENYYYYISKDAMDEEKFRNSTKMFLWERAFLKEISKKNNLSIFESYSIVEQGTLKTEQPILRDLLEIWPDVIIEVEVNKEIYLNFLYGGNRNKFKLIFKEKEGKIELEQRT